jgi:hypothetical protein
MNEVTVVRRAVDRLLDGALEPLLDLLAEDVEFEVFSDGDVPGAGKESGRQAVADYFTALRGVVAFWQVDYTAKGEQVIAWGKESFTLEHCELEGGCQLALVFTLSHGVITRLLMIEDLRSFLRSGGSLGEAPAAARRMAAVSTGSLGRAYRWSAARLEQTSRPADG